LARAKEKVMQAEARLAAAQASFKASGADKDRLAVDEAAAALKFAKG
jgi:hypothetical protein